MAISIALRPVPEPIEVLSVTQDLAEALESLGDGVIEVRAADLEQLREESKDHRLSSDSVNLLDILIEAVRDHERSTGSEDEYFSIDVWY